MAKPAAAYYVRTAAVASCHVETSAADWEADWGSSDSRLRNSDDISRIFFCETPDFSDLPRSAIDTIYAYVLDDNNNSPASYVYARSCSVDVLDGNGGECGP